MLYFLFICSIQSECRSSIICFFVFLNLNSADGIALVTAGRTALGNSLGQLSEKGINHAYDEVF